MKTKKCESCWAYVRQRTWKTKEENNQCLACAHMKKIMVYVGMMVTAEMRRFNPKMKREWSIQWKFIKSRKV